MASSKVDITDRKHSEEIDGLVTRIEGVLEATGGVAEIVEGTTGSNEAR